MVSSYLVIIDILLVKKNCHRLLTVYYFKDVRDVKACQFALLLHAAELTRVQVSVAVLVLFLPRCIECRRGLTMRIMFVRLSVRLSVCLSNACIVTKRKKDMFRFLYQTMKRKIVYHSFLTKRMVGEGRPILP